MRNLEPVAEGVLPIIPLCSVPAVIQTGPMPPTSQMDLQKNVSISPKSIIPFSSLVFREEVEETDGMAQ